MLGDAVEFRQGDLLFCPLESPKSLIAAGIKPTPAPVYFESCVFLHRTVKEPGTCEKSLTVFNRNVSG